MRRSNSSKLASPIQNILLATDLSVGHLEQAIALRDEKKISLVNAIEIVSDQSLNPSIASKIRSIELFELSILYGLRSVSLERDLGTLLKPSEIKDLFNIIPLSICQNLKVLPLYKESKRSLVVGSFTANDSLTVNELNKISRLHGIEIQARLMLEDEFYQLLDYINDLMVAEICKYKETDRNVLITNLHNIIDQEPVQIIPLVEEILILGVAEGASEIAIAPHDNSCSIKLRIDGNLEYALPDRQIPKEITNALRNRLKLLANLDITQSQKVQTGKFQRIYKARPINFHIYISPITEGGQILVEVLDGLKVRQGLVQFANQPIGKAVNRLGDRKSGTIVVTGGSNSGMTTTLYALLEKYIKSNQAIATVENPIELSFPNITQVEVKTADTMIMTLRSLQQQKPDLVSISEIASTEVAQLAAEMAKKAIVLAGLAASHPTLALTQLIDTISSVQFSVTLEAIVYQQLVHKLCPWCRIPTHLTSEQLKYYCLPLEPKPKIYQAYRSKINHCCHCGGKGYWGQLAVFEIMEITGDLHTAIAQGLPATKIRKMAINNGMKTALDWGLEFLIKGLTTLEELDRLIGSNALFKEDLEFKQRSPLPKQDIQGI